MPELDDHDLDRLLATLETPEPPTSLSRRIIQALPERRPGFAARLISLLGLDGQPLALPAGGALACLMLGLIVGYSPLADLAPEADTSEDYIETAFSSDPWDGAFEEFLQ